MTMAEAVPHETAHLALIAKLRERYEGQGFSFKSLVDRADLPPFLGAYVPDAIASKPGLSIAIEVKSYQSRKASTNLESIRQLFKGRPGWQLAVFYAGTEPLREISILPASPKVIRERMDEIGSLSSAGHRRAAFVMAWTLLEAALNSLGGGRNATPLRPDAVLQALSSEGYIDPTVEQKIRPMIALRNRIVHGDVNAEPNPEDVALLLAAIDEVLAEGAV